MKEWSKSKGLIAATLTPFRKNGSVNFDLIQPYIDHLVSTGIRQVYVNGTAAENASMTVEERQLVAEKWMEKGRGKLTRIIVHCGAGNLNDTKKLAIHAESIGADCIAVILPTYYLVNDIEMAVEYCVQVAKVVPKIPFMYYHFPGVTKTNFRLCDILQIANKEIPNLIGAKCTSLDLHDACNSANMLNRKFDISVGADQQHLGAMAMGLSSAVGISYSFLGKPFTRMIEAFDKGDISTARKEQWKVHQFWDASNAYMDVNTMIATFKTVMKFNGLDFGPARLPINNYDAKKADELKTKLDELGFWAWIQ